MLRDFLKEWQSRKEPKRPWREWIQAFVTALPGLAAAIALIFTWQSINATKDATNRQLQITEQGQVTDRYNAAITNLGSPSVDVRLGGIYALQRIMQDSPRDQPTVVAVLCAFIRDHAPATAKRVFSPPATAHPPTDIQAALTVVTTRNIANDGSATFVDLNHTKLIGARLSGATLIRADLIGADLTNADLTYADLTRANLGYADLTGADLGYADLTNAKLPHADLTYTRFIDATLTNAFLFRADLTGADLTRADLTGADLTGTKGLPPGIPRSPTSSTPASTKNLRRWATRLAACGLAWVSVGRRDVGHAEADRQGGQAAAGLRVVAVRAGRVVRGTSRPPSRTNRTRWPGLAGPRRPSPARHAG